MVKGAPNATQHHVNRTPKNKKNRQADNTTFKFFSGYNDFYNAWPDILSRNGLRDLEESLVISSVNISNPLWPSPPYDEKNMAQIMAVYLTAPSNYHNQCELSIKISVSNCPGDNCPVAPFTNMV